MNNCIKFNSKSYSKVYIDTSALLKNPGHVPFLRSFLPLLHKSGGRLTIPQAVLKELRGFVAEGTPRGNAAKTVLTEIYALHKAGYIAFEGNPNAEDPADVYFLDQVMKARIAKTKILIISQDFQLAKDLLSTNNIRSSWAPAVNVQRINTAGCLQDFSFEKHVDTAVSKVLRKYGL